MASGPGKPNEDEEENPFSFNSFMKKSSKKNSDLEGSGSDDESDSFDDIHGDVRETRKADDSAGDNPFSFRKFLYKGNPSPASSTTPRVRPSAGGSSVPDVASGLPDFVQDHIPRDSGRRGSNSDQIRQSDIILPDFVMGTNDIPSTSDASFSGVFPSINAIGSLIGGREDGPAYGKNSRPSSGSRRVHTLASAFMDPPPDDDDGLSDLNNENHRLKEENAALRRQLFESRDMARNESERVTDLLKQIKTLQSREAYETAALEKMVQQVESNLEATTERAVRAESVISRQKQEIKHLKEQLSSFQMNDGAYHEPMDEFRDTTQYMSQQLAAAATNAESTLKQMMGGVQNLRIMSDILASIGRISDEPEEESESQNPKSAPDADNQKSDSAKMKSSSANSRDSASSSKSATVTDTNSKPDSKSKSDSKVKSNADNSAKKKPTSKSTKETAEKSKKS